MTYFDNDYDDREDCDHVRQYLDWQGYMQCENCGRKHYASPEEVRRWESSQRAADAEFQRELRRERNPFRRAWRALKARVGRLINKLDDDSEIPF